LGNSSISNRTCSNKLIPCEDEVEEYGEKAGENVLAKRSYATTADCTCGESCVSLSVGDTGIEQVVFEFISINLNGDGYNVSS